MKLTIRNIQHKAADLDIEDDVTIAWICEKVSPQLGFTAKNEVKLLHAGRMLDNGKKISECGIQDNSKLIAIEYKAKKTAPVPSVETTVTQQSTTTTTTTAAAAAATAAKDKQQSESEQSKKEEVPPTATAAPAPTPQPPVTAVIPALPAVSGAAIPAAVMPAAAATTPAAGAAAATGGSNAGISADGGLLMGQNAEDAIQSICGMGFSREDVEKAMRAAFNSPERAVDYLLSGVPLDEIANRAAEAMRAPPSAPQHQGNAGDTDSDTVMQQQGDEISSGEAQLDAGGGPTAADFMRLPIFEQLRAAVRRNPSILPHVLQMIHSNNPMLGEMIANNEAEFMRALQGGGGGGGGMDDGELPSLGIGGGGDDSANMMGNGGGAQPGGRPRQMVVEVHLTPEEAEAVQRLCEMGFSQAMAIQAYVACDKNEELAANFLFDNQLDDTDDNGRN